MIMTCFLLSVTNSCNKACAYCVVKQWRNNPEYPDKIAAIDVIKFLGKEMKAGDTVELTGGEPTLFTGLLLLLEWLREHNARVIMRTNGCKLDSWRKEFPNMVIVLAKHDSSDEYIEQKRAFLLPHDIVQTELDIVPPDSTEPKFRTNDTSPLGKHGYTKAFFVTADGNLRFMPCVNVSMGNIINSDYSLEPWSCLAMNSCPYMLGAWNLAARMEKWSR